MRERELLSKEENENGDETAPKTQRNIFLILWLLTTLILVVVVIAGVAFIIFQTITGTTEVSKNFSETVKVTSILGHLNELQKIATDNGGSRAPTTGYNASGNYIESSLNEFTSNLAKEEANAYFTMKKQYFLVDVSVKNDNPRLREGNREFEYEKEFVGMHLQGSGNGTWNAELVPNVGCEASDFANFTAGKIALITRGLCVWSQKAIHAQTANAKAVIILNTDNTPLTGSLGISVDIPVISVTSSQGDLWKKELEDGNTVELFVYTNTTNSKTTTYNILYETIEGEEENKIVIGAHLDGVEEGPGINDNGSGSSSILELAVQYAKQNKLVKSKVIFAFWAAEEMGLLGSAHYVRTLTPEEKGKIRANLNFDMLGSPNYRIGVYDGKNAEDPSIRYASGKIQQLFQNWFTSQNISYDLSTFDGRSDYGPFIDSGIPAGGLDSGAEVLKSEELRVKYGGVVGLAFDPCYHLHCDNGMNINQLCLQQLSQAAANVLDILSSTDDLKSYLTEENNDSSIIMLNAKFISSSKKYGWGKK